MGKKFELVTKRFLLKDVNPDVASLIAKEFGKDEGELQFVRKGFEPSDIKFDEGENSSVDYITTKSMDRDGEIVDPSGVLLDVFKKHPIVVWCHDYKALPLGKSAWIKADDKGLISKTIYATKANPFAKQVYEYRKDGFPLGKSVGFVPLDWEDYNPKVSKGLKRKYKKVVLLEYSDVPIPSNADALQIAVSKGLLSLEQSKDLFSFIEQKGEEGTGGFFDLGEEGIETKSIKMHCETCKGEQDFDQLEGEEEYTCKVCGNKTKKPVKKEDDEDIEQKAKGDKEEENAELFDIVCPECGEEFTADGKSETATCPSCKEKIDLKKKEEKKEVDDEEIKMKTFLEGNPSTYDIMSAIGRALSPVVSTGLSFSYGYVVDLYPINYPSGKAIVYGTDMTTKKERKYAVDYTYKDGEVTVQNPSEVEVSYVKKSIGDMFSTIDDTTKKELDDLRTKQGELEEILEENDFLVEKVKVYAKEISRLKEIEEEYLTIKEGRVLSGKNRTLLKNCIEQMNDSLVVLGELMNATDVTGKALEDEEEEIEIEEEEEEDVTKSFSSDDIKDITQKVISDLNINKTLLSTLSIEKIINRVHAKVTGKVTEE